MLVVSRATASASRRLHQIFPRQDTTIRDSRTVRANVMRWSSGITPGWSESSPEC